MTFVGSEQLKLIKENSGTPDEGKAFTWRPLLGGGVGAVVQYLGDRHSIGGWKSPGLNPAK